VNILSSMTTLAAAGWWGRELALLRDYAQAVGGMDEFGLLMRMALVACTLCAFCFALLGSLIVVNRLVFIAGGISHAVYGGVGLAIVMGYGDRPLSVTLITCLFALFLALVMGTVTLKARHRADTVIGVMWAAGMAMGILLVHARAGYSQDLMSYLFGSINVTGADEMILMVPLTLLVAGFVGIFYTPLVAMAYDEEFARLRGVPVVVLYFAQLGLVSLTVVIFIRIMGLIMVLALVTIGPYLAERFSRSLWRMMLYSFLLNFLFLQVGLYVAFTRSLPTGPSVIMVAVLAAVVIGGLQAGVVGVRRRAKAGA